MTLRRGQVFASSARQHALVEQLLHLGVVARQLRDRAGAHAGRCGCRRTTCRRSAARRRAAPRGSTPHGAAAALAPDFLQAPVGTRMRSSSRASRSGAEPAAPIDSERVHDAWRWRARPARGRPCRRRPPRAPLSGQDEIVVLVRLAHRPACVAAPVTVEGCGVGGPGAWRPGSSGQPSRARRSTWSVKRSGSGSVAPTSASGGSPRRRLSTRTVTAHRPGRSRRPHRGQPRRQASRRRRGQERAVVQADQPLGRPGAARIDGTGQGLRARTTSPRSSPLERGPKAGPPRFRRTRRPEGRVPAAGWQRRLLGAAKTVRGK